MCVSVGMCVCVLVLGRKGRGWLRGGGKDDQSTRSQTPGGFPRIKIIKL